MYGIFGEVTQWSVNLFRDLSKGYVPRSRCFFLTGRGGNEINLRLDPKESGKLHSGLMKIDAMARSMVEKIIFSVVIEAA